MKYVRYMLVPLLLFRIAAARADTTVLVKAERFAKLRGWVIDQQSMDQMGSPYVLAHGLGRPVADAATAIDFPAAGVYRVWVRTRDWVGPWKDPGLPKVMQAQGCPGQWVSPIPYRIAASIPALLTISSWQAETSASPT